MKRWRGLKDLLQDAVDKGTTAVERVHKDVARTPFAVLEHVPPLADPARLGWSLLERAITETYETIRAVNRMTGELVGVALDLAERQSTSREHPAGVHPSER